MGCSDWILDGVLVVSSKEKFVVGKFHSFSSIVSNGMQWLDIGWGFGKGKFVVGKFHSFSSIYRRSSKMRLINWHQVGTTVGYSREVCAVSGNVWNGHRQLKMVYYNSDTKHMK